MLSEIVVTSQSQQACELAEKSIRYQMDAMTSFMAPQADVVYEIGLRKITDNRSVLWKMLK